MTRNSLRRLGALVLSLALTLSLAPPAWAAGPSIEINPTTLTLAPGGTSANVTATLKDGGGPAGINEQTAALPSEVLIQPPPLGRREARRVPIRLPLRRPGLMMRAILRR